MEMITLPRAVLLGTITGLFTAGLVLARDEHRCGTLAFIIGAAMNSALSILLLLGLEALGNLGGI